MRYALLTERRRRRRKKNARETGHIRLQRMCNDAADLIFFSPKEAQLLFRQLQKLSTRNITALNARSGKPNVGY